jgi:hypothetical protein
MYKFKSLTRSGQLVLPHEAQTQIPDTTQTPIDIDTDTDTDMLTPLIIYENHIIQCNYMFRCCVGVEHNMC